MNHHSRHTSSLSRTSPLISRRDFVGAAAILGGGLVLGVNLRAQEEGTGRRGAAGNAVCGREDD
jgi:hypothetical protein